MTIKQIDEFCMKWKVSAQNLATMMPMNMGTFNNKLKRRKYYNFSHEEYEQLVQLLKWLQSDLKNLLAGNDIGHFEKHRNLRPLNRDEVNRNAT